MNDHRTAKDLVARLRLAAAESLFAEELDEAADWIERASAETTSARTLVQAKAEAERVFDEWNDVAGVFARGVSYDAEIRSVIDDAVTIGWDARAAEKTPAVQTKEPPHCPSCNCEHWTADTRACVHGTSPDRVCGLCATSFIPL